MTSVLFPQFSLRPIKSQENMRDELDVTQALPSPSRVTFLERCVPVWQAAEALGPDFREASSAEKVVAMSSQSTYRV